MKLNNLAAIFLFLLVQHAVAWDYEGHRAVNELALAALPTNFPAFVFTKEARERIAFLAGEPDRWRNVTNDPSLSHVNAPDHYLDIEELSEVGLSPETLPPLRYDFMARFANGRAAHPKILSPAEAAKNRDHTRELAGFLPWAITEYCGKLRSGFSSLKAFREYGGTPEEIANEQASIIYVMGVMGHFVGDGSQPLHTTVHHAGWVGDNPKHFTTNQFIHAWIDGGFFRRTGGINLESLSKKIRPAKIVGDPLKPDDLFRRTMDYLQTTHKEVERVYQMNKDGKLRAENPDPREARAFLEERIVAGGQMLGDLWFSCWQQAAEDTHLIRDLKQRARNSDRN